MQEPESEPPRLTLTNIMYGVPSAQRAFESGYPEEVVLASGASKGLQLDHPEDVQCNARWVTARRAALIGTASGLVCGDWRIPFEAVERLSYLDQRTLLSRFLVLKVWMRDGRQYHFGLQYDERWLTELPLKPELEAGRITYSWFSIAVRLGVVAYLAWEIFG